MADVTIDIIADPVCPWCYLGYRRLQGAVEHLGDSYRFKLNWLPFELHPDIPATGVLRDDYLGRKFGSQEKLNEVSHALQTIGAAEGIEFNFSPEDVVPNTLKAHQLMLQAVKQDLATPMMLALFDAYFTKGENIGLETVLTKIAKNVGLEDELINDAFTRSGAQIVQEKIDKIRRLNIQSVPSYIINEQFLLQGARSPEEFAQAIIEVIDGRD
ncbi:DsbA family oxidoreductase [Maribrevibacterium harenarium]|uniref:DsbA family oxidoreductase n=1 Tax=Maribrevibacterium harenarium TaxID=2589817 RepID=A0A501WNP9_9GAMM|nr:DsbA family oxidoreductase [Maribrevibacterium harenarium]TPE48907.1 DsbA family oxidoreductase [Maribrevibacterium harenarium]